MSDPVVVIDHMTKQFGEFTAVDELSMTVDRGRILGFIGPNGAGKTTTIKILVGLARPTFGRAMIAGADCVTEAHKIKKLVGYMPDKFGPYPNMRVREYLDFFGAAFKIPKKERKARIQEVLEITRATYMQDRYVEALSHGMQQRVGIARTGRGRFDLRGQCHSQSGIGGDPVRFAGLVRRFWPRRRGAGWRAGNLLRSMGRP